MGHGSLIKNKTLTEVIKIVSFHIFVNLTFRMLFNIQAIDKVSAFHC